MQVNRLGVSYKGFWKPPGAAVSAVTYLLRDEFTTDVSPISSPRTCEPGPGSLQTGQASSLDIVSSTLVQDGTAVNIIVNSVSTFERATGLTFYGINTSNRRSEVGCHTATGDRYGTEHILNYQGTLIGRSNDVIIDMGDTVNSNDDTPYEMAVVCRTSGNFYLIKGGSQFTEWTVLQVTNDSTKTPLYYLFGTSNATTNTNKLDDAKVFQMGSPWNDDYGIATQRLEGSRSVGDTYTHEADCLIEMEVDTVPSSDQIELEFRQQTANTDCWRVTVDSSGNIDLDEVVSSSATQRGTAAGVIANSDRVLIRALDETIRVYEANDLKFSYTSAANFKTETSGELETEGTGGAVSEIISWISTLSGDALTELEKY